MLKKFGLAALAAVALAASPASAVTYFLNDSNTETTFPDGTNSYLSVKITNPSANTWNFLVDVLSSLPNGTIQEFGFNYKTGTTISAINAPAAYEPEVVNNSVGPYGTFMRVLNTGGNNSVSSLSFDVVTTAASGWWEQVSTGGSQEQPRVFFAAHVIQITGFDDVTSAFFGGSSTTPLPPAEIPIPAAAWLLGAGLLSMGAIGRRRLQARA